MFYAEFEPGILIFLLWGLLSFLSSKSKQKDKTPFNFDLSNQTDSIQDINFDEDNNEILSYDYFEKELKENKTLKEKAIAHNEVFDRTLNSNLPTIESVDNIVIKKNTKNQIYKKLFSKKSIRNSIIMMEILNKPKSLK